jgi:hypothetical protein
MRSYRILYLLLLLFTTRVNAQIGGENTYRFLSLTNSARVASMGGNHVSISDTTDLNLPYHNPALLHPAMARKVLVNYVNYLADINYGYASYALTLRKYGTMAAGMHYINYGSFAEASEEGLLTGNYFTAAEYALNIIWSDSYQQWRYGANIKPVLSVFESYQSFGLAFDAGIAWFSKNGLTSFGLAARNFGSQITTYYDSDAKETLPFDIQAGISYRLAYAPLVISLNAHQLNNWTLAIPESDKPSGQDLFYEPSESLGKQVMRHLIWGVEILPSPAFTIRAGYNYHLRQELKVEERLSTVGFSLGFGVKVKRFRLDYASTRYHLAGSSNHFSLAFDIGKTLH